MRTRRVTTCSECSSPLAIRTWCEATDDGGVRLLWRCTVCGSEFETVESASRSADGVQEAVEMFWPTLLVA